MTPTAFRPRGNVRARASKPAYRLLTNAAKVLHQLLSYMRRPAATALKLVNTVLCAQHALGWNMDLDFLIDRIDMQDG